jgi:hypothetical protein
MLRAVLLGVLSLSAVACKSKPDAPAVAPDTVAGKVVELTGAVTAGAKPLAVGDTVKADDAIETGADASVVIVLAHNNARWSVGPNRKVKASESAAWTAERGAGGNADQDTSSAGRPAERSAADTSASARDKDVQIAPESARADTAPGTPAVGGAAAPATKPPVTATPKLARPEPEKPIAPGPTSGGGPTHASASRGIAPPAPPPPPPPPPTVQPQGDVSAAAPALETPRGGKAKSLSLTDVPSVLSKCVAVGTKLKLSVHIAAHVPTIKFLSEVDQKTKDCLVDAAKHMTLAPESGDIANLELTR